MWMCIYGVDVLYVNITVVMCIKSYHGVSWCVVERVLSVSQVFLVCCDGVAVMVLSRSSCSHVHTILFIPSCQHVFLASTTCLGVTILPVMVYGHPFILPLW